MRFVKLISFFIFILLYVNVFSQDSTKTNEDYLDEKYIQQYRFTTFYLNAFYKYNNIGIIDNSGRQLKYLPNVKWSIGPGFSCKWFGLSFTVYDFWNKDESIYGKTKRVDIQTHQYFKRFMTDFVYQKYTGFYLDSLIRKTGNAPINTQTSYIKPDLNQQTIGGSIMYFTNYKRYSFKSTFSQNEFQKKSAGAWTFGLSFHYLTLNSSTGIIPDSIKFKYIDSTSFYKSISSFNAGIIGGYFHTFTIRKWYTTIATLLGFQGMRGDYVLEDNIAYRDPNFASLRLQIRFGTGFNSRKFYYGLNIIGDGYLYNNSYHQYGVVRFYMGYRIVPKRFLYE